MLLYGTFEERGYTFEAYIPTDDAEPVAFELRIIVGGELKHSLLVPMTYTPTFGVDAGDRQMIESILDRVLAVLPNSHEFGAKAVHALEELETEIGGKQARKQHQNWLDSPGRRCGQFEYTTDLFAAQFAELVGGREAMDKWMKTKTPQFGDRTPEEALHLGMTQAVINHLLELAQQSSKGGTDI
ncbi:hypothetical protein DWU98_20180 [Dyella monticola]|uniref:Uncharacterized protein n=1 Tax=Dyella monticola TaxID=1927958 RepID=A0A370WS11_9GAMM|nr:hypothetical protein [Dyella monticola]RDS78938.1 hypothetical protein DWU98_20180 [Dyella monticola]